jgi:hypothetical protein
VHVVCLPNCSRPGCSVTNQVQGMACGFPILLPAGDLAFKMADQRYLWSVLPCLMAWPTIAMPTAAAAGIQVCVCGMVGVRGGAGGEGWLWCVHLAEASLGCLSHPGRA